jgi:putative transposase
MLEIALLVARQIAIAHDRWRARVARRRPLAAEIDVLHEMLERARTENELLRARLRRLPARRRPRYTPWERLRILWHAARHGLSVRATARAFVVSVQTIVSWRNEVARGVARLVQSRPPVNRLPDLVADLARRLKREWPRWGTRRIAGILARLGIRASRTTVQRMLRRPRRPAKAVRAVRSGRGPLVAKRPGHIWLIDFTRLGGLLRSVRVGAVIDAFSRRILSIGVVAGEPPAAFAVRLLREAVSAFGPPVWIVHDHGTQFTSHLFTRALRRCGIRRRFGAVGRTGSLGLVDRFFRSLKEEYARGLLLYRPLRSIERRLRDYVAWFNAHRPHQGNGGRTPDEVHSARDTRARSVPLRAALHVNFIASDRQLPVLRLRPAA